MIILSCIQKTTGPIFNKFVKSNCLYWHCAYGLYMKRASDGSTVTMSSAANNGGDGNIKKIGTHNGTFHCDEALACAMLKLLPDYKNAEIVRSRDESVLSQCTVVCDVGGIFDPAKLRFDHHQRSFTHTMSTLDGNKPWEIKLSSAGLVYAHFGRSVIAQVLGLDEKKDAKSIEMVFDKVYENFVQEVDAIDNGVNINDGGVLRYHINTNLSSRVKHLNPSWNDSNQDTEDGFRKAMALTIGEFIDRVKYYGKSWLPAREVVLEAINSRFENGQIIEFKSGGGCPWKEHLFKIEEELGIQGEIKYALYTDLNGSYRVQAVPISPESFDSRLPLPAAWRGVRDNELSSLTGIDGCIFVHASGFIGGAKTRDGALQMAKMALKLANN